MSQNSISIKKIAELAGTSVATVSRVINKNGRYSKETEEKILRIMEEYDYTPNILARGLRQNKMKLVGVIVPDITNVFFAQIYSSIELELYKHGYLPVLCNTNEYEELEEKYIENLKNLRFSGLICLNGTRHYLAKSGLQTIYVDRYPNSDDNAKIYFIGSNNFHGGYLAAEALIKAGKKRPAIVLFEKVLETQRQRCLGFMQALKDYSLSIDEDFIYTVDNVDFYKGYEITKAMLQKMPMCDGIFFSSDILALGGLHYLNDIKVKVPEEIAVIGMDGIPLGELFSLTTIKQPTDMMGRLAASSIVSMINGEPPERDQILDVELIRRGTL